MTTYKMQTTDCMEHSNGIAWTADLLADGVKIGIIEQDGHGGADRVYITDPANIKAWREFCATHGGEEQTTYMLLCIEEGEDPDSDVIAAGASQEAALEYFRKQREAVNNA
jgi:hypothetical protein